MITDLQLCIETEKYFQMKT